MNIGIIGSGDVAKTLAAGFLKHGHTVMIGSRDPAKLADFAAKTPGAKTGTFEQAADFGPVIVLAVNGKVSLDALKICGADRLAGKTVIDVTNPIADAPPVNGVATFFTTLNESLLEQLQKAFPSAKLVKAFNSVGAMSMVNPQFPGGKPTMFICGNDDTAKKTVSGLIDQFGWETADMGKVESARAIEPLCMLWLIPVFSRGETNHAFKLLKR